MLIGVGGIVFLNSDYKIVGAVLFSVGLFTIMSYELYLYTGRTCYVFDNDRGYALSVLITIIGNFVGCLIMGLLFPIPAAVPICEAKLGLSIVPVLAKGFGCGILMCVAVDQYREKKSFIATFICVPTFIMAGFEHSIADMFYLSSAGIFTFEAFLFIIVVLIGNFFGCTLLPLYRKLSKGAANSAGPQ